MNREIEFKAKRKDNGKWVCGDLLHNVDCIKIREKETDIHSVAKSYIVVPKTVGQFTGLKDKNGVEIYEGDIVERKHCYFQDKYYRWRGVIKKEYSNNMYLFLTLKNFDGDFINGVENVDEGKWYSYSGRNDVSFIGGDFEVVGNIHDNPELLEGKG